MLKRLFPDKDIPSSLKTPGCTIREEENGEWLTIDRNSVASPTQLIELNKTREDLKVLEASYQKICEDFAAEKNYHAKTMESANKIRENNVQLTQRMGDLEKNLVELEKKYQEHKQVADNALDTLQTQEKYITDIRQRLQEAEQSNVKSFKELADAQNKIQTLHAKLEKYQSQALEFEKKHIKESSQVESLKKSLLENQSLFKACKQGPEASKKYEQLKTISERSGSKPHIYHRHR